MQAVGTNALPYLLSELQVTDPAYLRWAENALGKIEVGPPWEPDRVRRYHARLALQILDTNALPTLLDAVFAQPMRPVAGDLGYEAACTLSWLTSPAAKSAIERALADAMTHPDASKRRNACLAISVNSVVLSNNLAQLSALIHDQDPGVRAAATQALEYWNAKQKTDE